MTGPAAYERVESLRELGRLDDAEREARAALAAEPADARLLGSLAAVLLRTGRHAEGLAAAEAACAAEPDYERAHRLRGLLASRLGRHAEALAAGYAAVSLAPDEPLAAIGYADVLQRAGRLTDALTVARRAVSLGPELAHAHLMVADISDDLGDRRTARAAYQEVLRLEPDHAAARHDLALQDLRERRPGRALRGLIEAGGMDPTLTQVLNSVGAVLWRLSWRLRVWLFATSIALLLVSPGGLWPRVAALAVLLATSGLGWLTVRHLPRGSGRVALAALRGDRPLAFTFLVIAGCLVVYAAIVVTARNAYSVWVLTAMWGLGLLALLVGMGRRLTARRGRGA